VIVCDTGPLVAAADPQRRGQPGLHRPVHRTAPGPPPDLGTGPGRRRGWIPARRTNGARIESTLLRSIVQQTIIIVVDLELADYERMAELVDTYADFPLGTTDAAVVAVADVNLVHRFRRSQRRNRWSADRKTSRSTI
jgi:hypothetical protein